MTDSNYSDHTERVGSRQAGIPRAGNLLKTQVQLLAEEVAASHLAIDVAIVAAAMASDQETPSTAAGIPIDDLISLVEVIGQIVLAIAESCPERSEQRIVAMVDKPTFWQRVRVRNIVKQTVQCSGATRWTRDSGPIADTLIDSAARAGNARITSLLQEVRSADPWLD